MPVRHHPPASPHELSVAPYRCRLLRSRPWPKLAAPPRTDVFRQADPRLLSAASHQHGCGVGRAVGRTRAADAQHLAEATPEAGG